MAPCLDNTRHERFESLAFPSCGYYKKSCIQKFLYLGYRNIIEMKILSADCMLYNIISSMKDLDNWGGITQNSLCILRGRRSDARAQHVS